MSELPPHIKQLGRYDIVRVLGHGAMGVVYEARDPNLDRRVAIKTVRVTGMAPADVAEFEQRFKTEARSAGRLQHPNIVSVYDSNKHTDAHGQTAYIVMEYIEGQDLKHFLDQGKRFSLEQTAAMMTDLLAALGYAHRHKIIHRDIKPANMLLTQDGHVKLSDFGVARIQDSGEATRTQGGAVGTLKYMSPEQVAGKPVDASTDLFSAGIVLYQLLTGVRPFDGEGYLDIVSKIVRDDPKPPSHILAALPPALDTVVARALAKSKLDRFPDAASFAAALKAAVNNADLAITPLQGSPAEHGSGFGTLAGSTMSGTSLGSGNGSAGGSMVTQEIELVYWKDVRDSTDREDFEGFLRRFPIGIYADLAKRKLKTLPELPRTHEQVAEQEMTVIIKPGSTGMPAWQASAASPGEATSPSFTPTAPLAKTASITAQRLEPHTNDDDTLPPLNPKGKAVAHAAAATTAPAPLETASPTQAASSFKPVSSATSAPSAAVLSPAAAKSTSKTWLIGLGTAAVIGALGLWFALKPAAETNPAAANANSEPTATMATLPASGTSSTSELSTETQVSLPAAPSTTATSTATGLRPETVMSSLTSTVPTRVTASLTSTVAALPAIGASAASRPSRRASAVTDAMATVTPLPSGDYSRITSTTPTNESVTRTADSAPASPRDVCKGRVLFGYITCIGEQCERPTYRNHPICEERRQQEERKQQTGR